MSIGNALNTAQNSLANVARHTQVVARNVTQAGDENHVRRESQTVSGGGLSTQISRATIDAQTVATGLDARSEAGAASARDTAVSALALQLNGSDGSRAPAAALSNLHDALQAWSALPSDAALAGSTLSAARDVVSSFERANTAILDNTAAINARIDEDVDRLNERLAAFGEANAAVIAGTKGPGGADLDALDARDAILRDIAELVPVSTITRADGDLVLMTGRGMTLFETVPRSVERNATGGLSIDRVALSAPSAEVPRMGRLEGHLYARDVVMNEASATLNSLAAATVDAFSNPVGTPGLFVSGAPLSLAAGYDPAQGGAIETLRGPATGDADALIATAEAMRSDPTALLESSAAAVTWLNAELRSAAESATQSQRTADILEEQRLQTGGVDIDTQMTRLLALERSYEASARLIAVADEMLASLMRTVQ